MATPAAIAMGRALEMEVVAEGSRPASRWPTCASWAARWARGFLVAPLPPEEIDSLLGADIHF